MQIITLITVSRGVFGQDILDSLIYSLNLTITLGVVSYSLDMLDIVDLIECSHQFIDKLCALVCGEDF